MFNLKVAQPLTEVLVIAVPHWGRNKHVLFDAWLGEVLPLGFQKEVLFFPPHILPPLPGMLPNWLCSLFQLLQLSQGESKKREGQGAFSGQYILAFHCSSYAPGSPLNVKLLYWLPSHLFGPPRFLCQNWTQEKMVWGICLHIPKINVTILAPA